MRQLGTDALRVAPVRLEKATAADIRAGHQTDVSLAINELGEVAMTAAKVNAILIHVIELMVKHGMIKKWALPIVRKVLAAVT